MFRIGTFGFTMIETVVVIVVTGLLAGVSVPRLADAGQEARVSVLAATAGDRRRAERLVAFARDLTERGRT